MVSTKSRTMPNAGRAATTAPNPTRLATLSAGSTEALAPASKLVRSDGNMPSMRSQASSRRRSSTPQVNAPCAPPPCNARSTRTWRPLPSGSGIILAVVTSFAWPAHNGNTHSQSCSWCRQAPSSVHVCCQGNLLHPARRRCPDWAPGGILPLRGVQSLVWPRTGSRESNLQFLRHRFYRH